MQIGGLDRNRKGMMVRMRIAFAVVVLAGTAVSAERLSADATRPLDWQAKWIGAAAATRPPIDMGEAKWIDNAETNVFRKTFELDVVPTGVCELAFTSRDSFKVSLNGLPVADTYWEHFHDWSWLRTLDVRKFLRCGTNELVFVVKPLPGENPSLVARLDCGPRRIVSDGTWGRVIDGFSVRGWRETEAPMFAKAFEVKGRVRRATLHVTGVGFYEARMDGEKIGDKVLDPAPTDYTKRVLYSTYELDGLTPGRHELSLLLGHGWYDQRSLSVWNFDSAPWRDFPRGIAQLEIEYEDGMRESVVTDRTWRQVRSPVRYDDIREGEIVEPSASGEVGYAEEVPPPAGRLVPETQPGARVVRTLRPESIRRTADGAWIVTFPENIAGWMRMRMKGLGRGQVVSFTYDERLSADGSPAASADWRKDGVWGARDDGAKRMIDIFFVSSRSYEVLPMSDAALQRDRFISGGRDGEVYEPRFVYHGFRYVVIRGMNAAPDVADIEACVVSADFAETGSFDCSDAVFNRLMANAARSYRGNFVDGFPTDCPHREKNGWTGDASMASEFAQYQFDNTAGYEKWLVDICDAQRATGEIPCIVPTSGWGYRWGNGPGWDSALPVIAWDLYRHKGDVLALKDCEQAIRRLCDFTAKEHLRGGLVDWGIGDHAYCGPAEKAVTREFAVSCFAMRANEIAAQTAEALGHAEEGARFLKRAEDIRRALRLKYRRETGVFDNGGQTAQAMALSFGIAEENERTATGEALVRALGEKDDHLDVGVYGMRFVPEALSSIGRTDLAFKALTQTTYPSPACWLRDGSTTLWESWNGDASRNHIMFGSFGGWAYAHLAGIRPIEPGYRRFMLAPEPIEALTHVTATVETPFGKVASAWKRAKDALVYSFEVPAGTTAEVRIPGASPVDLGPGSWTCENGIWERQ